jgi:glycosyltransferase involved in cell wall biosynthesis
MRLAYISPSILPSRYANSVHVVQQCAALGELGIDVTLFGRRSIQKKNIREDLRLTYGVELERVSLSTFYTSWSRGNSIAIAAHAILKIFSGDNFDLVFSRNLFASFFLAFLSKIPLVVEVHQIEFGFRGWLQRATCRHRRVKIVVISKQLRRDLVGLIGDRFATICVLPDAAPGMRALPTKKERLLWRRELFGKPNDRNKFICGYVGHLYPGRGIDIIESLANDCPDILFVVIGGNESDVNTRRLKNHRHNLFFLGHMPHPKAMRSMSAVDILLMPYQRKVSIGIAGHDTGKWMSPMKMFEYMSSGTPFIASDLPILREILCDGKNAILVSPTNIVEWRLKLEYLKENPKIRRNLAHQAYVDFENKHTWQRRAEDILKLIRE